MIITEDKDLDLKIKHIQNIRNYTKTNDNSEFEIFIALMLYKILKKWGFQCLPLRILHELDVNLINEYSKFLQDAENENAD